MTERTKYRRYPKTTTQAERTRVAALRRGMPAVPEGWHNRPRHIRRLNSEDEEGIFSSRYVSGDLRIAFVVLPPADRVQYSVSREGGLPTDDDIKRIRDEWFPEMHVEAAPPLGGVVYLRVKPAN